MKRSGPLRRRALRRGIGTVHRDLDKRFQQDWSRRILRLARCAVPGCPNRADDAHHVVYKRDLIAKGIFPWDLRDGMPLCRGCHDGHHYGVSGVLPVTLLGEQHLEYAFEVLGPAAYDYLLRRYRGPDPRLEARLAAQEARPDQPAAA